MIKNIDASLPMDFTKTPKQITDICNKEKLTLIERLNQIATQESSKANFETSFLAMELAMSEFTNAVTSVLFLKDISSDETVRKSAALCSESIGQLFVEIYAREDLYKVLSGVKSSLTNLDLPEQKLVTETLSAFIRNGLALDSEKRKDFIAKKQQIVSYQESFQRRVAEGTKEFVEVSPSETVGLSDAFIAQLEKLPNGNFKLKMDKASVLPFLENAKSEAARKRVDKKYFQLGSLENVADLEATVKLRHETAVMLGYRNHAHFVLDKVMAKSPEAVETFLASLTEKLMIIGEKDLAQLKALKSEEFPGSDSTIHSWDYRYFSNQWKIKKYNIDGQKVKEYFPLETVIKGMFEVYETLLGVTFEEVSQASANEKIFWHPSVKLFQIKRQGTVVAHFFMDLFPRDGKYNHFAAFELVKAYLRPDGTYRSPVAAIVGNFSPPTETTPSLLEHDEVETMFHEFGHIMHQTLTNARFASLSGTSVMTDFVEAPSQMLENWVWQKDILAKISGHYQAPEQKLPDAMVEQMLKAKLVNSGIFYLRQASFALIDMKYHTSPNIDAKSTQIYADIIGKTMLIPIQDGTYPQAGFGHLMGGYDAGYYSYLWSKVYAEDMFTRFEKEGLLNEATGQDYVRWILEPGGIPDPFAMITGFLGREPNNEAFLKSLGLASSNVTRL